MRSILLGIVAALVLLTAIAAGCAAGGDTEGYEECPVGSERCKCTTGGACDSGLECLSGICVNPNGSGGMGGSGGSGGNGSGNNGTGLTNCEAGCQAIDVIFALDSSGSMGAERNALAATAAFEQVVTALAAVNCSQIDYRVGVTDDNRPNFFGSGPSGPWFDSLEMNQVEIATAFNAAVAEVSSGSTTGLGCEHVLTNATNVLLNDQTGFVRDGALLVLVLVTDVDDYGAYDHATLNACSFGCNESFLAVPTLLDSLTGLKGDTAAVAAVIVAGDPSINGGVTPPCDQPCVCGFTGSECDVYHSTRLWELGGLLGNNGFTANLCDGPNSVPGAVQAAFEGNIDLACKGLDPPK